MLYDCDRCGTGYQAPEGTPCICKGMTDAQVEFVKGLHAEILTYYKRSHSSFTASFYY